MFCLKKVSISYWLFINIYAHLLNVMSAILARCSPLVWCEQSTLHPQSLNIHTKALKQALSHSPTPCWTGLWWKLKQKERVHVPHFNAYKMHLCIIHRVLPKKHIIYPIFAYTWLRYTLLQIKSMIIHVFVRFILIKMCMVSYLWGHFVYLNVCLLIMKDHFKMCTLYMYIIRSYRSSLKYGLQNNSGPYMFI